MAAGVFAEEIVPVETRREGKVRSAGTRRRDRVSRWSGWRKLKPAFTEGGTVTAGNSSGINDGAAALRWPADSGSSDSGLEPLARIVATAVAGCGPELHGTRSGTRDPKSARPGADSTSSSSTWSS